MYIEGGNNYSYLFQTTILISFKQHSQPILPPIKYQIYPKTFNLCNAFSRVRLPLALSLALSGSLSVARSLARTQSLFLSCSQALPPSVDDATDTQDADTRDADIQTATDTREGGDTHDADTRDA